MTNDRYHLPLWLDTAVSPGFTSLDRDMTVDVCVIGAGITGLTTAHELKKAGLSVVVLEQKAVVSGMSGHTTAHLTQAFDTGLMELVSRHNSTVARTVWEAGRLAIDHIERTAHAEGIACDFKRVPAYYFAAKPGHLGEVKDEAHKARELGFVADVTHERVFPPMRHGAMRLANQAQFHPTKYLYALAGLIHGDGCAVFEHSHVDKVHAGQPARVEANGFVVTADHVVYATHQPIHQPFFATKVPAYQTYAIGVRIPEGTFHYALAWDTEEPYHYWRLQPGKGFDTLIVGGEDHRTGQDDHTARHYEQLEAYVTEHLGEIPHTITHRWTGQWLEPVDGIPFIGRKDGTRNEYLATGFSGNGMTFGVYAGLLMADQIMGREHPAGRLFDPSRLNLRAGAISFITENLAFPLHLVMDRFGHPDAQDALIGVKSGEGQVLMMNGDHVACFRDDEGKLHMCSAVCTHMACIVRFNDADTTWDCPCHGSRYTIDGEVVAGPAKRPLAHYEQAEIKGLTSPRGGGPAPSGAEGVDAEQL